MRWLVRGDLDGFFGLALDNLVQLLLIGSLCRTVLGFPDALILGTVLPAAAVSLLVGNLYYGGQAIRLAQRTGRQDVCALPYGINTVSLFAFVFLVMLPARRAAELAGSADPAMAAWRAGLLACLGSGLVELGGAFMGGWIRRATPRAALLSTLAGIALAFISLGFLLRTYAQPLIGLTTLGIVLLVYLGRVRLKGGLPGGLVAVALGTVLAWMSGTAPTGPLPDFGLHLFLPRPVVSDLFRVLVEGHWLGYLAVIVPMGIFNVLGSLQNIESAEAAGDVYPTRRSMLVNGMGTMAAALFGSCFPTTIYIGHPGWKAMGARAGYSVLNAAFFTIVLLTGTLAFISWAVPVDVAMAIVLWIGLVITAQAFQVTPTEEAPAVVLGLLPAVAAWGALMAKNGLRAAGMGIPGGRPFSPDLVEAFRRTDTWIGGALALEQGFILTSMLISATVVFIIRRRFVTAAAWCGVAASLSAVGLIHSYRWLPTDTVLSLTPAWPWALGYAIMGVSLLAARFLTHPVENG
ncbi:MAG: NCS2 family permease [Acidobacteriota bacterium]